MLVYAIDQATRMLGHCLLDTTTGKIELVDTINAPEEWPSMERIIHMNNIVQATVDKHKPQVVVIEDYAYSKSSNADAMLKELGGVIKFHLYHRNIRQGRQRIIDGQPTLMIQGIMEMKKFVLGKGNLSKDTGYLLAVLDKTGQRFKDDNQADAYMHAFMGGMIAHILLGKVQVTGLLNYQQEVLLAPGLKVPANKKLFKGMTINKVIQSANEIDLVKLVGY